MALGDIHDHEFLSFRSLRFDAPSIADVGANRGQSIWAFKTLYPHCTIDSFEPNPAFHEELDSIKNQFLDGSVRVHRNGLSNLSTVCKFYIPEINGIQYLEEVSMKMEHYDKSWIAETYEKRGGNVKYIEFDAPVETGDSLGMLPDIIKIDVEGAESLVVLGFGETIERCRPIVIVENSDWDAYVILESKGYVPFISDDENVGSLRKPGPGRTNTFYLPKEKLLNFSLSSD